MFRKQLVWTTIFGLAISIFLTLIVVPAIYLIVFRIKSWVTGMKDRHFSPATA